MKLISSPFKSSEILFNNKKNQNQMETLKQKTVIETLDNSLTFSEASTSDQTSSKSTRPLEMNMRQPSQNISEKLKELKRREDEQRTIQARVNLMR